jgi:hypothetical protein
MLRRSRGWLLRFVRRRGLAVVTGLLLIVPAVWMEFGIGWDAWWVSGLALVLGATGAAVLWTGLTGVRPDYFDSDH